MRPSRARTLAHMRELMTLGAAVGVVYGCGKETKNGGSESKGCGKSSPMTSSGYTVVDAMPPPAHCPGIAQLVGATATFDAGTNDADPRPVLTVVFPRPKGRDDYAFVTSTDAVVYGGTLVRTIATPESVIVKMHVDLNATTATVSVKGNCDAGPGTIMATVTWAGAPSPTTKPTLTMNDY